MSAGSSQAAGERYDAIAFEELAVPSLPLEPLVPREVRGWSTPA